MHSQFNVILIAVRPKLRYMSGWKFPVTTHLFTAFLAVTYRFRLHIIKQFTTKRDEFWNKTPAPRPRHTDTQNLIQWLSRIILHSRHRILPFKVRSINFPVSCAVVKLDLSPLGKCSRFRMSQNSVLEGIFETSSREDWRKVHNKDIHNLYSSFINLEFGDQLEGWGRRGI